MPDQSILIPRSVTLKLPPEFIALCRHHQVQPADVLRGFIADLCGIVSYANAPRTDEYASNGSDERLFAQQYFERVGYALR